MGQETSDFYRFRQIAGLLGAGSLTQTVAHGCFALEILSAGPVGQVPDLPGPIKNRPQVGNLPHWVSPLFSCFRVVRLRAMGGLSAAGAIFSRFRLLASDFYTFRQIARLFGVVLLPKPGVGCPPSANGAAGQVGGPAQELAPLWLTFLRFRPAASDFYRFRRIARLLGLVFLPKPSVAHDFRAAGGKKEKGLCLQRKQIRKAV
jgi:hypothetical protein